MLKFLGSKKYLIKWVKLQAYYKIIFNDNFSLNSVQHHMGKKRIAKTYLVQYFRKEIESTTFNSVRLAYIHTQRKN